jgi:phytoene dehydrogenase-like protein
MVTALSMSAHDYVSRWFESDIVKAKFMFWATIGGNVGPYSPGTAFYIVSHLVGQNGMCFPKGGMGGITQALACSGECHGMQIRTGAKVEEILVHDNRARGVRLTGGEEISARAVISNVSAKLTFNGLVARKHLPEDFAERIDRFRARGMGFKLLCAVDRLPRYKGFDAEKCGIEYPGYAHIGPTPEFLEKAFDEAKYGWYSSEPFLSPSVASYFDPSLAPEGKHVVTFQGGVTPYELRNGDWDHERDGLVRNVMRVMDRFAPGFSDSLLEYKLYLPKDIEDDIAMPGGNTQHGELALDQLFFMRPVPGYADYRSPVAALYQCGASTHPGGAVSAVNGHNAAGEILADWKRL